MVVIIRIKLSGWIYFAAGGSYWNKYRQLTLWTAIIMKQRNWIFVQSKNNFGKFVLWKYTIISTIYSTFDEYEVLANNNVRQYVSIPLNLLHIRHNSNGKIYAHIDLQGFVIQFTIWYVLLKKGCTGLFKFNLFYLKHIWWKNSHIWSTYLSIYQRKFI
jgi:hypothetical protein